MSSRRAIDRNCDDKRRTLPQFTDHRDAAAHHLTESMADGQPKPTPFTLARDGWSHLSEWLEDSFLVFGS
jgi:hypothetical protein